MQDWAYKCAMSFNPDRAKPAKEVIFSRKTNKHFSEVSQNHLGLNLDARLMFSYHIT